MVQKSDGIPRDWGSYPLSAWQEIFLFFRLLIKLHLSYILGLVYLNCIHVTQCLREYIHIHICIYVYTRAHAYY